jgi:hypothetical protein
MVILLSLLISAVAVMAVPLIAEPGAAAAVPDPSEVYIKSVTYGGSGCSSGTASYTLSKDCQSSVKSITLHLT